MEMPTRNGISIPISELVLPDSNLDLSRPESFNNHHNHWEMKKLGRFVITQTLRDLSRHQFVMPKDVHQSLHRLYEPPKFPTLEQAMKEVDDAYQFGEMMKIYLPEEKRYVQHPISFIHMQTLNAEYNQYRS